MAISQQTRSDLKILAVTVVLAAAVGTVYDMFLGLAFDVALAGGGVIGILIGGALGSVQVFGLTHAVRRRLRRFPPSVYMAVMFLGTLGIVIGAIRVGMVTAGWMAGGESPLQMDLAGIVFSLAVSAIFVTATSVHRMVGTDVLLGIFTGRYLAPRQEHRVFLFADLVGSTALAEHIGDLKFHRYVDTLVHELTEPVARHRGQIYRYVGDELIVTWRADRDPARAARRALACVRDCQARLAREAARFETAFGHAPEMRYALHAGPVVAGKMGEMKREIVFLGDTVNTTARLEEAAKTWNRGVVVSGAVLDTLDASWDGAAQPLGTVDVRGKRRPVQVYAFG